jgi:transposase
MPIQTKSLQMKGGADFSRAAAETRAKRGSDPYGVVGVVRFQRATAAATALMTLVRMPQLQLGSARRQNTSEASWALLQMRIRNTRQAGGRARKGRIMADGVKKEGAAPRASKGLIAIHPRVAGIDIGSRQMYVCGPASAEGKAQLGVYGTTTGQIEECAQWLRQLEVESVAMESTGVYWIPVLEILESRGFEVLLVDTRPLSRVPGRKTDIMDCQWIQTLHSCGLLQGCYRPTESIGQLRTLVRDKAILAAEQSDWLRRIQKCLDQMNVRVHHAVSDMSGTTGLGIVRAIVAGERDPLKLAELRDPRCQKSREEIAAFLAGHWRPDHLFSLGQSLKLYDTLAERIADYEREIQLRMRQLSPPGSEGKQAPPLPNREKRKAMKRRGQEDKRQDLFRMLGNDLTTVDGIGTETAEAIVSEYGIDLDRFASEKEFVSHLQLAPRQAVSGGKPLKKRGRNKSTRAGQALRMAATAVRRSTSALGAYYRRISRSKGAKVAVFATARKMAQLVYRMLRWGQPYLDQGQRAYEERFQAQRLRSLAATASQFGFQLVKNTPSANA